MAKFYICLLLFQILAWPLAHGQKIEIKTSDFGILSQASKERISMHYNAGVLFAGETLLYKIYCIDTDLSRLSTLSKVAYLDLMAYDGSYVFRHKIRLNSGQGQGDFFVPSKVPSGNYVLVGYTNWMKNKGEGSFFRLPMTIINPYIETKYLANDTNIDTRDETTVGSKIISRISQGNTSQNVKLSLDTLSFKKREKVSLTISSLEEKIEQGTFSLSVRKVSALDSLSPKTLGKPELSNISDKRLKAKFVYLPELRGELISGSVIYKDSGLPTAGTNISLSIPGQAFVFDVVSTDQKGRFFFNLSSGYDGEIAIIQSLVNSDSLPVEIRVDNPYTDAGLHFELSAFNINSMLKDRIEERSIHSQIENAYSEIRQDTLISAEANYPFFYEENYDIFNLDDYTRFPSVKETFIEIIQYASIRKSGGKMSFSILPSNNLLNSPYPPLVLVDGIQIPNHEDIIAYGARNIQRILIFREKFFYGSKGYQGALVFETVDGDYFEIMNRKGRHIVNLFKPQPRKKYFKQVYEMESIEDTSHIPDYRYQLLWEPNIRFDNSQKTIDFFTSDVSGNFEISLEGFTDEGVPVSIREVIVVE